MIPDTSGLKLEDKWPTFISNLTSVCISQFRSKAQRVLLNELQGDDIGKSAISENFD